VTTARTRSWLAALMAGCLALATATVVTAAQPISASPLPHQIGWASTR